VRVQPEGLDPRPALRSWGIEAVTVDYLPVGFGDHHWRVVDDRDRRWFVTVADLEHKPHNGIGVRAAKKGLRAAMDTAAALAHLDFVLAPVATQGGQVLLPIGKRYAISVFPYLDGVSGRFGDPPEPVGDLLATLHRQPPPPTTPVARPQLPGRAVLEDALTALDHPWTGGPFAERARELLAARRTGLRRRLAEFDRLVDGLRGVPVVTHGEPHPGNVLRVGDRRLLLDWDTVGLAVPERDLWWLPDHDGQRDASAVALYRLRWDLDDVAVFVGEFRSPHRHTEDTEQAWAGLADYVERLTG
jgi:spectinomycin phosphotransferase